MSARSRQEKMARQASFIFEGTVQKLKAATMSSVPVTDNTVVVHVDNVKEAPKTLLAYGDKDITVELSKGEKVKEGEKAVFYTNGWMFGDGIAVQSIGHTDIESESVASSASASDPVQAKKDRELQEHLADADMVVAGKVIDVKSPDDSRNRTEKGKLATAPAPVSEHSARWRTAIIDVNNVIKGDSSPKQIAVQFPSSN